MATLLDAATGTTRPASAGQVRRSFEPARQRQLALEAGYDGKPLPAHMAGDPDLEAAHAEGRRYGQEAPDESASSSTTARPDSSSRRLSLPKLKAGDAVDEGAGFLLGLFVFALGSAYVRGGWPAVQSWLAAKFVNRAAGAPSTPKYNPDSSTNPDGTPKAPNTRGGPPSKVSPPSSEGYHAAPPGSVTPNTPPPVPPGWQNPFATGPA